MKKDVDGELTQRTVRGRYQAWFGRGDRGTLPGRTIASDDDHYPSASEGAGMSKTVLMGIGVGIGLVLLLLAALSYGNAASWGGLGRDGAAVGYTLVGFFLTIAGLGAILATLNHNLRAAGRPAAH